MSAQREKFYGNQKKLQDMSRGSEEHSRGPQIKF